MLTRRDTWDRKLCRPAIRSCTTCPILSSQLLLIKQPAERPTGWQLETTAILFTHNHQEVDTRLRECAALEQSLLQNSVLLARCATRTQPSLYSALHAASLAKAQQQQA